MDQTPRLNRQKNTIILFHVEVDPNPRVFFSIEAFEINSRLVNMGLTVGQTSLRNPTLVYEKFDAALVSGELASLLEASQQQFNAEFRLCGKIEVIRESCVFKICFAKAVASLQDEKRLEQILGPINARQQPTKDVIPLNVRSVNAKFLGLSINFRLVDHLLVSMVICPGSLATSSGTPRYCVIFPVTQTRLSLYSTSGLPNLDRLFPQITGEDLIRVRLVQVEKRRLPLC